MHKPKFGYSFDLFETLSTQLEARYPNRDVAFISEVDKHLMTKMQEELSWRNY
jgi:hypothetical protein